MIVKKTIVFNVYEIIEALEQFYNKEQKTNVEFYKRELVFDEKSLSIELEVLDEDNEEEENEETNQ